MGTRGPIPRRRDELAHPMSRRPFAERPGEITKGSLRPIDENFIQPDKDWGTIAKSFWDAAFTSGQQDYYQHSDIAMLYFAVDELDQIVKDRGRERVSEKTGETYWQQPKRPAMHVSNILGIFSNLLMTEGDRRRARLELENPREDEESEDAKVLSLVQDLEKKLTSG